MLNKIKKLMLSSRGESSEVYNKIVSIAAKIEKETIVGKDFVLINIEDMESWVSPGKIMEKVELGRMELDL